MPRKGHIKKIDVMADVLYNSKLVTKLINNIMKNGKKRTAELILYGAFEQIKEVTQRDPMIVFNEALKNTMPLLEVRSRRIGGQKYQVPSEVRPERRHTLALRWLVKYAKTTRNEKTMQTKLAKEIIDAAAGNGATVKKREEMHRISEANKAFAQYRW